MRLIRPGVLCIILSFVAFTAFGQEFSIKLHGPTVGIEVGSEIHVVARITNTSDHEVRFAKGFGEEEFDFEIEVRDEQGKTSPLTESYRNLKEHPTSRRGSYSTVVLEPGKSFDDDLMVTHLYLLKAGKYEVRVTRGKRPMWQIPSNERQKATVTSNTITLTVAK